ncbi:hypothetical protein QBC47DRAFT_356004 [Echria macrotheca]|uniref:Uncharacterized protein n=1 Tax=Echria macrotheca TaxID=438768 RepID=A0AAJ0BMF1_9PEZI|nr:hypothetical protein QBC47DRAFT_356004 [Echria macrotheca]
MASSSPQQTSEQSAVDPTDYKTRLDQAATKARSRSPDAPTQESGSGSGGLGETIVEKVSQYIPAAGKVLGKHEKEEHVPEQQTTSKPGPPNRPDHDPQIEEFVRDQHRSMPITSLDE